MVMLAAEILLRRVQALLPTVEGLTLPDLGDAATWEVHGLITREEGRRALQIIRDQLTGPTGQCYAGL